MEKKENNENRKPEVQEILNESNSNLRDQKYNQYVNEMTPAHNWIVNMLKAFFTGGIICIIGQFFIDLYIRMGMDKEVAGYYNVISLILLSVILTGLQIYPKFAKFGGAGTVVPITGFANSVAAPAIEYKKEGQVFGIGCKIFTIAGPVILYGVFSSWVFGIIYYIVISWKG